MQFGLGSRSLFHKWLYRIDFLLFRTLRRNQRYKQLLNKIYKGFNGKYKKGNDIFIQAFQVFKILIDTDDKLIIPMKLTDEVLNTQFYDKVGEYKTLQYNIKMQIRRICRTNKTQYKILFDLEALTSEHKHMPYLCWIYKDDIQQGFIGINTCAVDMLHALPTDKGEILLIAHNSDHGCRSILEYLQNVKPIEK